MVSACCHRERDVWVDEQARNTAGVRPEDVGDDTYRGVWLMPPEVSRVHVFAADAEAESLISRGAVRTSQR